MAQIVLTDCFISLDAIDISGVGTNVAITTSAEAIDATPFGNETRTHLGGTKEWAMEVEGIMDETLHGSDLWAMRGTVIPVVVRATSAVVGAGNPSYMGDALVVDYSPISGAHGELQKFSMSLVSSGDLTRAIA